MNDEINLRHYNAGKRDGIKGLSKANCENEDLQSYYDAGYYDSLNENDGE